MFFGTKFFVVGLVGWLILKVVPQDTNSTSGDNYTSSSSLTTTMSTDSETSEESTSSDLLSTTPVSETSTSSQITTTTVTANQSALPTSESQTFIPTEAVVSDATETTSASDVPTTLQTDTTLQANSSTTTLLVSSTTQTTTASTDASPSSTDTLTTLSSSDFSTSSTNADNSTTATTAANISLATTIQTTTAIITSTDTETTVITTTAAATNTSSTDAVTNTSSYITTAADTNTSSTTTTAPATNASLDITTAADNTSLTTIASAVTDTSSATTTSAVTDASSYITTAADTNTSSATTTEASSTLVATSTAAADTSSATTTEASSTLVATSTAAADTSSTTTTSAVTNASSYITTAADTNTSSTTTTEASSTLVATSTAAADTSSSTTTAAANTSLTTITSAVTNASLTTSLATTSAVTNTSLATTTSAVTNTSSATTTAAVTNTSLATTTAGVTTTTAATSQATLPTTTSSGAVLSTTPAAQGIVGAASQVNVSSANAQENIVNVLDTIDRSVNSSISGDSALDNYTQAIRIIVDKIAQANWTQSQRRNTSEKVLQTASTVMQSLAAYSKQTNNYSSEDVDKKFSSLESDLFDLGATLTRGREKEYISSNLLKVQYRSSRPENLVDETTENGDVSLSLPDGLVNNFRTKALLVTLMVYEKDVYTHALSTSKIVPSGKVAVVNVVDEDKNPVSAVSMGGPVTVTLPPPTFQPSSASGTARADDSAFCSEAPPSTLLLLQFIVPAGRKLTLLGHFGTPPTTSVYEFEATVTSEPHVTLSHDDITLVLQDGVAKVYVKRISRTVEQICFAASYSDLLSESPRRRLLSSETAVMQAVRVSALSVVTWDSSHVAWTDNSEVSVRGIENNGRVWFKSNFIGKFSLSELIITPTEIDFSAIFLNFERYLHDSPYVLSVICWVLLVSVFVTVLLRRLDVADSALWTYLPLTDNRPDDPFVYTLSVHTSLNSPRHFTATPVFVLTGQFASTHTRVLADGVRENFRSGTVSNFVMTSQVSLGQLLVLNIWHDNKGNSPHWKLDRVVVVDRTSKDVALFVCRDWLSTKKSDGRISRHLPVFMSDGVDGGQMFDVVSWHQLFDEHLWLSIFKRLTYSRFTRVQRFLCAVALLFLAMVTDAMFFKGKEATYEKIRGVTIGPLQINYRQLYTGFVSGLIIIVPAVIMTWSFKHRDIRGVNSRSSNGCPQSTSSRLLSPSSHPHPPRGTVFPLQEIRSSECLSSAPSACTIKSENGEGRKMSRRFNRPKFYSSDPVSSTPMCRQSKSNRLHEDEKNEAEIIVSTEASTASPIDVTAMREMSDIPIPLNQSAVIQCSPAQNSGKELTFNTRSLHPWWFIFVGYFFIFLSIVIGAFFCIMFSLEWGGSRSQEWLLAVVFTSSIHVLVIEPVKIILVSFILSSILWHQAHDDIVEVAPYSLASRETCNVFQDYRTDHLSTGYVFSVCEDLEELESRHKDLINNQRMHTVLANLFFHTLYLVLLYVLCHHISDNTIYIQNRTIKQQLALKELKLIDLPDKTWDWVQKQFIPSIMSSYNCLDCASMETKNLLLSDGCNLRVGPVIMTQYRIKDICSLPPRIHKLFGTKHCKPSYSDHVEESRSFLSGWVVCTANCTEKEYVYDTGGPTSMAKEGVVGVYGPGGYQASLGQTEYAARKKVAELLRQKWLDQNTRALSIEVNLFNANTQLFSQAIILVEFLTTGGCFWKAIICSARLYPYTGIWDYFVLVLQLVFIVIIIVRAWFLIKGMCFPPDGHRCLESVIIRTFELLLSLVAIITYILRIDKTIYIVERIKNNPELHTSFDAAFFLDKICQGCLGICFFLKILWFLGLISFNYYIQLFRKTLLNCLSQLYGLSILLIVILSAFVSLIYLSCGAKNSQFKGILESYMTLNTLLLTITRYQDTEPEGADRQQLVFHYCAFGLYCFIAPILVVNLAITILDSYLEATKKSTAMKDPRSYNGDLGRFVWRKLEKLWLSCTGSGTRELKKTSCGSADLSQATVLRLEWDYLEAKVDQLIDMLTRTVFHPSLEPTHVFHIPEPNALALHHRQHHQENEEQVKDSSEAVGIQPQVHTLQLREKTLIRILGKGQRLLYLLAISNASTESDIKWRASGVSHKFLHQVYDGKHALLSEAVQIFCAGSTQHQDVEVGIPVLPYARQESCALAVKFTASEPWTYLPSVEYSDLCTDFHVGFTWTRMQAVPRYLAAVICLAQKHPKDLMLRQCPQCKFSTCDPTLLRNHLAVHSSLGLYVCRHPGCVAQFLERYQLVRHLQEKHNFPQVCHFCGEGFQSAHVLREHIRGHYIRPFKCDICGLQFLTPQQKDGHCFINHSDWKPKLHF